MNGSDWSPSNFGQRSVWRSLANVPAEAAQQANLGGVVRYSGKSVGQATDAVHEIAREYSGLRVQFAVDGDGIGRQWLLQRERKKVDTIVQVVDVDKDPGDHDLLVRAASKAFDILGGDVLWRATVYTRDSEPFATAIVFPHIVADNWVSRQIRESYSKVLAGGTAVELMSPVEVARRQQSEEWRINRVAALSYWLTSSATGPSRYLGFVLSRKNPA